MCYKISPPGGKMQYFKNKSFISETRDQCVDNKQQDHLKYE